MSLNVNGTYKLSEFQFATLDKAANGDSIICALLEPSEKAPVEEQERDRTRMKELDELIELGLMQDVSHKFTEPIEVSRINNNRAFRVFALTETSISMFYRSGKQRPN